MFALGRYVDATFGREACQSNIGHLRCGGSLLVLDRDPEAIAAARGSWLKTRGQCHEDTIRALGALCLSSIAWQGGWHLFDLGVSSPQLDNPSEDLVS